MAAVEFRIEGEVAVMTLNRPEARNALNGAVMQGLGEGYAEIVRNPAIRVGVLAGAGGNFCSGMDLKAFASGEKMDVSGIPYGGANNVVVDKPIIAAIEGYALAGGFELAMLCDLIVASRTAKFGLPETKRGLVPGGGGLVRLPRLAPMRVAMEMVLTGDTYDADTLHQHGLINRVVGEGGAFAAAMDLANKIAANGPVAVSVVKKVMQMAADWPTSESFDRQREYVAPVFLTNDAKEGARAFAEKRAPKWTGT